MEFLLILVIGISVSMDAFSLSLAYGTLGILKSQRIYLSLIVSVFHFFMPIFGYLFGNYVINLLKINPDIVVTLVLMFIGIDMIASSFKKEDNIKVMRGFEYFLFGFAVSIDSFSVGMSLTDISKNVFLPAIVFSLCSGFFTFVGLTFGNKIEKSLGKVATIGGGVVLSIIGIIYAF